MLPGHGRRTAKGTPRHALPETGPVTTAAPLPGWRALGDAMVGATVGPEFGDDALAGPWRRADEAAVWFSRGAWALEALARWREATTGGRPPVVWLPGYFCNQSTVLLRKGRARLVFYPVGPGLEPDWEGCARLARDAPPDLFVLVHTFGHAGDADATTRARRFCDETGVFPLLRFEPPGNSAATWSPDFSTTW